MTVVEAVIARLETLTPVTVLVSDRIVASHLDEDSDLPVVLVQFISSVTGQHLRGPNNIKTARVQIDSIAVTKQVATQLAQAVEGDGLGTQATGLFGFKGAVGSSPAFLFENVRDGGGREDFTPPPTRRYAIQRDFLVDYQGD